MEYDHVALRLARLREQKGVSARDMSLSIGQNSGYINNIETGKALPSLTALSYICDYLGITLSEFFDWGVDDPAGLRKLQNELRHLNARQLEHIAAIVGDILDK